MIGLVGNPKTGFLVKRLKISVLCDNQPFVSEMYATEMPQSHIMGTFEALPLSSLLIKTMLLFVYMSLVVRPPAFCKCKNKDADQLRGQRYGKYTPSTTYIQNFKPLAIFYCCTARFVSDLVGNPEDRFSQTEVL